MVVQSRRHSTWISSDFLVFCLVCPVLPVSVHQPLASFENTRISQLYLFHFTNIWLSIDSLYRIYWDLKVQQEHGISKLAVLPVHLWHWYFGVGVLRSNCPAWYFQVGVLRSGQLQCRGWIGFEVSVHSSRFQDSALLTPPTPPHLHPTPRSDFLHKVVLIDGLVFLEGILTLLRFLCSYTAPSSLAPLTTHFLHIWTLVQKQPTLCFLLTTHVMFSPCPTSDFPETDS